MQAILGAGGAIGMELAKVLPNYTNQVRLVARNPKPVLGTEELFKADLLHYQAVKECLKNVSVAYLCVGLPYRLRVWQEQWPVIIENVIRACSEEAVNLVFFDNIYMFHPQEVGNLTESSRKDPRSAKGKLRYQILNKLWDAHNRGQIKFCVARSADFYGPGVGAVSLINEGLIKPLKAGKKANWFGKTNITHHFTYVPDAAKATAMLGNSEKAWGQEWNLPTDQREWTAEQYVEFLARELKQSPRKQVANGFILSVLGLFNPTLKEFKEMLYQYEQPYRFRSAKFEREFQVSATPYEQGLKSCL